MAKIIGIDLGTTNSCVAVIDGKVPQVIPGPDGGRLTPSAVHFRSDGTVRVGLAALKSKILEPENTIVGIKRFIGRRFNEIVDLADNVAFKVFPGPEKFAFIEVHGRHYSPQEISAYILRSLKNCAERFLGDEVKQAVITVPAYFGDHQERATMEAAVIAGLEPLRIINEPTAAALAYGLSNKSDELVAVFDLGGGTFDISILEIGDGVFEVKSIAGDGFLGGDDFDRCLVDWIMDCAILDHGIAVAESITALEQIRKAATEAKCDLSSRREVTVDIPHFSVDGRNTSPLFLSLSRERFESICEELFDRLILPCKRALKDAGLAPENLSKIILVGAATRMRKIDQIVYQAFVKLPSRAVNPDEAVALGAAIQGGVLRGTVRDILLLDVTAHTLGVEATDGTRISFLPRNTTIPTRKSQILTTSYPNQETVEINILEGEGPRAFENRSLARLVLEQIPPAPAGKAQIEVTFDIDANAILHVAAKDLGTNREKRCSVTAGTGLTHDAIEEAKQRVTQTCE